MGRIIKIGDRFVEVEDKDGIPTIKADVEEIRHPDGRVDILVKVPCIGMKEKKEK